MFTGIHLTILIGQTVPVPAPAPLLEALRRVEVAHGDEGRSGFQLTFAAGRAGPLDLLDDRLVAAPVLRAFSRVILMVTVGATPQVIMDGFITHQELAPSSTPGASTFTVTGEDVSVKMDLADRSAEHPAQDETMIANKIILSYTGQLGVVPKVIPPPLIDLPLPTDRTPVQTGTDLEYLRDMASRFGYVFYISAGPAPGANIAYWGPPVRVDLPQRALSVNLGEHSNVTGLRFRHDALAPTLVSGRVHDRLLSTVVPIQTFATTRLPPLALLPTWLADQPDVRTTQLRDSGLTALQALLRAQGITDASIESVSAEGELDAVRYGDVLRARGLVGVRGAGVSHDGLYYVKRVTHVITRGEYRQRFTLTREGLVTTTPVVRP